MFKLVVMLGLASLMPMGQPVAQIAPTEPPYESQLKRLSELLGSIHYLAQLCDPNDNTIWRNQMEALLVAENPSAKRRVGLISEFNKGYRSLSGHYKSCNQTAEYLKQKFILEGAEISGTLRARYSR